MLRDWGVQRGDRVALLLDNSSAYIAAYYGILKAGGVTVAMYATTTAKALAYIVNDCEVSAARQRWDRDKPQDRREEPRCSTKTENRTHQGVPNPSRRCAPVLLLPASRLDAYE